PNFVRRQEIVEAIVLDDCRFENADCRLKEVVGVLARGDTLYREKAIVLTTGTFLTALMHTGESKTGGGRAGHQSAESLSDSLTSCGFELARFKTGTPCR